MSTFGRSEWVGILATVVVLMLMAILAVMGVHGWWLGWVGIAIVGLAVAAARRR